MLDFQHVKSEFLDNVVQLIEDNLSDEHFGVSELAEKVGMSRSNLLRKVQKLTNLSVSVLIRQVRLRHAQQLLKNDTLNVSQIAYEVGFNSVSYFIKCYKEQFGHPPGEEHKKESIATDNLSPIVQKKSVSQYVSYALAALVIILVGITVKVLLDQKEPGAPLEKSIAVLPFQNDSSDSSNIYIINGLMEAILNNLQKIEDLRVVSRTSVEKYRDRSKSIAEISNELDVNYFIEGSGQKLGEQILLTIQLIEAPKDKHLWSNRYNRKAVDIFELQAEVAKDIAEEVKVIITPDAIRFIEKKPTENLLAYDHYLKGLEKANNNSLNGLNEAIIHFKNAIKEDADFAHAHAYIAICYYYLDLFQAQKKYLNDINTYADRALLLDAELPHSLIAKGLFCMESQQYELAAEYFEKVLQYNPNSARANNLLSDIYNNYLPDTKKYLMHALRGSQLDKTNIDSITTSITYLHLGNALAQSGFLDEAEKHLKTSIAYDPSNIFSEYVHAYVLMAKSGDLQQTREALAKTLAKDTTRLDVLQELAKICYAVYDFESAYQYYSQFIKAKEAYGLNIFESEDLKIAFVLDKIGKKEEAIKYSESYKQYADIDESIYKDLSLSAYYAVNGNIEEAIQYLKAFSKQKNYQYWFVLFLEVDPILSLMSDHPDFKPTVDAIKTQFWNEHHALRKELEAQQLL